MKLGIIGKPQSGKTTIFNAAAEMQEAVGDYSQATHRAVIKVPDSRLAALAAIVSPKKITPAEIEFYDAPGLSGKGKEGGGFEFSAELRQSDAFLAVIDAFSSSANPVSEVKSLIEELILLDQAMIETNIEKKARKAKLTGDRNEARELELLQKMMQHLEQERPLIEMDVSEDDLKLVRGFQFLSLKPLLLVINISEEQLAQASDIAREFASFVQLGRRDVAVVCGKIEMELVGLAPDEKNSFMADLGIAEPAVSQVISKSYTLLGLISFLTAGEPEVRAWTIRRGFTAPKAAGVIHSDIERGFIRAEVIRYTDYVEHQTMAALKSHGKIRLEGKEYLVDDGDVILFRFNV